MHEDELAYCPNNRLDRSFRNKKRSVPSGLAFNPCSLRRRCASCAMRAAATASGKIAKNKRSVFGASSNPLNENCSGIGMVKPDRPRTAYARRWITSNAQGYWPSRVAVTSSKIVCSRNIWQRSRILPCLTQPRNQQAIASLSNITKNRGRRNDAAECSSVTRAGRLSCSIKFAKCQLFLIGNEEGATALATLQGALDGLDDIVHMAGGKGIVATVDEGKLPRVSSACNTTYRGCIASLTG
jgi:hypothetical protein